MKWREIWLNKWNWYIKGILWKVLVCRYECIASTFKICLIDTKKTYILYLPIIIIDCLFYLVTHKMSFPFYNKSSYVFVRNDVCVLNIFVLFLWKHIRFESFCLILHIQKIETKYTIKMNNIDCDISRTSGPFTYTRTVTWA